MLVHHPGSNAQAPVQPSSGASTVGGTDTFAAGAALVSITADFLGWSPNYPVGVKTRLDLGKDELVIAELNPPLSIRYQDIEGIEVIPSKQVTTGRALVAGPLLATSWKKMEWFLCIRYRDDAGIQMNLMFSPWSAESLEGFLRALYQNLRDARQQDNAPSSFKREH